ncbi:plectin-like isoform X5 [Gossypium australe]|uniref:Plectin-like isoform X5 n=1 Tax=Gossypium australe TaxID=47621 RepID=A0A5B6UH16_9ROSI|nr:plectin-like isoform X5 [Gossypium australe]
MASTTVTLSPSSPQLRLALRCRNSIEPRALLVGAWTTNLDSHRRLRLLSLTRSRSKRLERRHNGAFRIVADSTAGAGADAFSGWSDSEHVEDSVDSRRNGWFEVVSSLLSGIIRAGSVGLVLVAGLSFAAMSIGNQSTAMAVMKDCNLLTAGTKQQLEPLTALQEVLLASDNETDKSEENESKKGIHKDLLSPSEFNATCTDNKLENDNGSYLVDGYTYNGNVPANTAPIQEALQNVSALDGMPIGTGLTPISPKLPESEVAGGPFFAPSLRESDSNLDIGSPEATSETKDNLFNVKETIDTNLSDPINLDNDIDEGKLGSQGKENCNTSVDSSSSSSLTNEAVTVNFSVSSKFEPILEPHSLPIDNVKTIESFPSEGNLEVNNLNESVPFEITSMSAPAHPKDEQREIDYKEINDSKPVLESPIPRSSFSPAGIPAPSVVSAALQVHPGKVLIPAVVDQVQGQALAALQVLKVIEADAQPSDLCTRREYARWLVSASGVLSRNSVSKVYPAMYIENVTELAFDDITPEDPDFSSIQGLAEAGLISSKLSNKDLLNDDLGPFYFSPESLLLYLRIQACITSGFLLSFHFLISFLFLSSSPLSRQDLVSWKMALEKRQLPEADKKILYQISGFIDIDKINPDAWPAVVADMSAGEQGIIALAFGKFCLNYNFFH